MRGVNATTKTRRRRVAAVLAVGVLLGTTVAATPASAHVTGSVAHLVKHLKSTFFTKAQSEARYVNVGEKVASAAQADSATSATNAQNAASAANADTLDGADSTAFLRATGKAADAELFDGLDSSIFVTANTSAGGDLLSRYPNPVLRGSSVGSAEVQNDSLTGAHIDESQLGQVPSAASAANAESFDGQIARTFNYNVPGDPGGYYETTFLTIGGLRLAAWCGDGGWLTIWAHTDADNSYIRSTIAGVDADEDWDAAEQPAGNFAWFGSDGDHAGTIVYRRGTANQVVTVDLAWDTTPAGCQLAGTAIGTKT